MSIKISKLRFLQYGKEAPESSRFKGMITTEALLSYAGYTGNEEKKEQIQDEETKEDNKLSPYGYLSSHHADYTISSLGLIKNKEIREHLLDQLRSSFHEDNDVFYENIISLKTHEEAQEYQLTNAKEWEAVLKEALPGIFQRCGFKNDNMIWFADIHINTKHPHIHIIFLEKKHTRKHPCLKPTELKYFKRKFYTIMQARKNLYKSIERNYQDIFKDKDIKFKEVLKDISVYLEKDKIKINDLRKVLPKTGRLQYNSYNIKNFKPLIDKYITDLIHNNEKIEESYNEWLSIVELLNKNMEATGENTDIATLKKAEIQKLYQKAGNMLLKNLRNSSIEYKEDTHLKTKKGTTKHKKVYHYSSKIITNAQMNKYLYETIAAERRHTLENLRNYEEMMRELQNSF